jgi:hypothetical protein
LKTRRTYRALTSDQRKNRALVTSGQEEGNPKLFFSFKQVGVEKRIEEMMLNGRIRRILRIDQSQRLFSLVQKQQKKSLPQARRITHLILFC